MADDEHIAVTNTVWVNVIEITKERDELRAEVERLRNGDGLEYSLSLTNADLRAENERLQRENGALARTYALVEEKLRERTEALNETLAQNERFDKRYRDAEAKIERLKIREETAKAAIAGSEKEIERLRTGWNECQRYMTLSLGREDALRAEVERLTSLANQLNDASGEKAGIIHNLNAEAERLRAGWDECQTYMALSLEREERLRSVADAARAFVEQHQIGQPGTPGTLYPMTYGVQDQWHDEWDRRLAALITACQT